MATEIEPTGKPINNGASSPEPEALTDDPRIGYREDRGYSYVRARPGQPKITSEEVKRMLEDFP